MYECTLQAGKTEVYLQIFFLSVVESSFVVCMGGRVHGGGEGALCVHTRAVSHWTILCLCRTRHSFIIFYLRGTNTVQREQEAIAIPPRPIPACQPCTYVTPSQSQHTTAFQAPPYQPPPVSSHHPCPVRFTCPARSILVPLPPSMKAVVMRTCGGGAFAASPHNAGGGV